MRRFRTKVTVKPVIDLNANLATTAYEVPDRIREQVILRDRTCVFPWCTRPARRGDIDHVIEFDHAADAEGRPQPGPTATWNLACLCRFHHRLKTHTAWRYRTVKPGVFEWTSPELNDAVAKGRPQPGPTRTANLACLCRFHHRLKTHTAWRYRMVEPGVFEWTSSHGHRYRRDHHGTTALEPPEPPDIPRPRRP